MTAIRATFDATIDEVTDVGMRLVTSTDTYRRQRRFAAIACGGSCVAAIVATTGWRAGWNPTSLAIAAAVGLPVGIVCAVAYGWYHDKYVERHTRRVYREMYRGASTIRCEIEARPDALWCRTDDVEITLPWSHLKRVSEIPDAIEFWFDPGLAVVRNRGFSSETDRQRFLETARAFLAARPDLNSASQRREPASPSPS